MKTVFTLSMLFLLLNGSSQCFSTNPDVYGAQDFTSVQYTIEMYTDPVTQSSNISYLKDSDGDGLPGPAPNPNLTDVRYPATATSDESCNPNNYSCTLNPFTISYVVYYPKTRIGSGVDVNGKCKFPAIILFHGGGFAEVCSSGGSDANNITLVAQEFARRGYVVFVVQYRTGRYIDKYKKYVTAQQSLAEYRAFQDARGAIRSIIYHQILRNQGTRFTTEPYQIDVNKIFLGGNSAGSIIALHSAYYNAAQIAAIFPTPLGSPAIADALGAIDIDYYFGAPTIEYQSKIICVLNMWGQMGFPKSYLGHFEDFLALNANIPPMIAFHGNLDVLLPINITPLTYAPAQSVQVKPNVSFDYTPYNSEYHCSLLPSMNPYTLDPDPSSVDLYGAGSKGIYDIFHSAAINQSIETYIDCSMGHGIKTTADNFGLTGITSTDQVFIYIVQRAATFFQAVLTGKDQLLNTDLFYDWENKRIKSYPNAQLADNPVICSTCNQPCTTTLSDVIDPDDNDNP